VNAEQWVTVTGNAVVLVGAILGYLSTRKRVERVHRLVNNRSDRQDGRIDQLTATLTKAGVDVPKKPDAPA
jgi:hypothetical protein